MKYFTPFYFKREHIKGSWDWLIVQYMKSSTVRISQVMLTHSHCACKSLCGAAYGNLYFLILHCYSGNHKSFFTFGAIEFKKSHS